MFGLNKPIEYELTDTPITALGGLPVIIDAIKALGVDKLIDKNLQVKIRENGYTESELALALILSLIAGGSDLDDIDKLRLDEVVTGGKFPHSTTVGDFLRRFSKEEQFDALQRVQDSLNRAFIIRSGVKEVILDLDASNVSAEGKKRQGVGKAYDGTVGYQFYLLFVKDLQLILAQDFRSANTSPSAGSVDLLKKGLTVLPKKVKLFLRSDSACYNKEVVTFCENPFNDPSGKPSRRIAFTISADKTARLISELESLPPEAWQPIDKGEEVAEFCYQPTGWSRPYRFIFVRKVDKKCEKDLLGVRYKYFGFVTNIDDVEMVELLKHHRGRGNVENGIKELKSGFSMSVMPCLSYLANRAWFHLGVIANNIFSIIKMLFLPASWAKRQVKTARWRLMHIGGVLVHHGRRTFLKLTRGQPWLDDLFSCRQAVMSFVNWPFSGR